MSCTASPMLPFFWCSCHSDSMWQTSLSTAGTTLFDKYTFKHSDTSRLCQHSKCACSLLSRSVHALCNTKTRSSLHMSLPVRPLHHVAFQHEEVAMVHRNLDKHDCDKCAVSCRANYLDMEDDLLCNYSFFLVMFFYCTMAVCHSHLCWFITV